MPLPILPGSLALMAQPDQDTSIRARGRQHGAAQHTAHRESCLAQRLVTAQALAPLSRRRLWMAHCHRTHRPRQLILRQSHIKRRATMQALAIARPHCSSTSPPSAPTPSPRPTSARIAPISTMRRLQQAAVAAGETRSQNAVVRSVPLLPSCTSTEKFVELRTMCQRRLPIVQPPCRCCSGARPRQRRAGCGGSLHVPGFAILQQVPVHRSRHRILVRVSLATGPCIAWPCPAISTRPLVADPLPTRVAPVAAMCGRAAATTCHSRGTRSEALTVNSSSADGQQAEQGQRACHVCATRAPVLAMSHPLSPRWRSTSPHASPTLARCTTAAAALSSPLARARRVAAPGGC